MTKHRSLDPVPQLRWKLTLAEMRPKCRSGALSVGHLPADLVDDAVQEAMVGLDGRQHLLWVAPVDTLNAAAYTFGRWRAQDLARKLARSRATDDDWYRDRALRAGQDADDVGDRFDSETWDRIRLVASPGERQAAELVGLGLTIDEAATVLGKSRSTIRTRLARLGDKLTTNE